MATINIYFLTFNCGRTFLDTDIFASQLFSGLSTSTLPDLLVLSLQEIAPIPHSLIGGSFLIPYFARFYNAVQKGARQTSGAADEAPVYTPIIARNLGMTGIMVFAKNPEAIQDIETAGVGLGVFDMGNKGAIGVRFSYHGDRTSTELTFVAAHLAAHEPNVQRRNDDWKNIVRGLVFSSSSTEKTRAAASQPGEDQPLLSISSRDASIYKPTSHLFFGGDLNYRTSTMAPSSTDHETSFPQPQLAKSDPRHISSYFESDQLNQERAAGRTLHGLIEAPITFPPTYKYNPKEYSLLPDGELERWHWATHRWPSWCDRILYLPLPNWASPASFKTLPKITTQKYSALPLFPTSDHRPVTLELSVPLLPIPPPENEEGDDPRISPPYEIDIDWKKRRERARMAELVVGFTMFFTTTVDGAAVFAATVIGAVGLYLAVTSMVKL
jgi:hypothetical protein